MKCNAFSSAALISDSLQRISKSTIKSFYKYNEQQAQLCCAFREIISAPADIKLPVNYFMDFAMRDSSSAALIRASELQSTIKLFYKYNEPQAQLRCAFREIKAL